MVVFPRTAVWITHEGAKPFVADPQVVTLYNGGQRYRRAPISPEGDRSDWFEVSSALALAIAASADPSVEAHPDRPFRSQSVPSDARLYLKQRELFHRLERGTVDPLEAEEAVLSIVAKTLGDFSPPAHRALRSDRPGDEAREDLACRARVELGRDLSAAVTLAELGRRLQVSPYHLCRVFRRHTGLGLHTYRLGLRLRAALERLWESRADLSEIAFELGFSSHSHLSAAFRRAYGISPSAVRGFRSVRSLLGGRKGR